MAIKRTRESEEMYLETILLLHQGKPNVRAVDVVLPNRASRAG